MKKQKGISIIALVITIIVLLILTAIVFIASLKTIDKADYSEYVTNVSDVSVAFHEKSTTVNGEKVAESNPKNEKQVYNYVAKAGNEEKDFLVSNQVPVYTIIKDENQLGIKLPKMIVESGTGKRVVTKYATTKGGIIFTWPPYNYGDELYITDKDTVKDKMQTVITVGNETFEIEIDESDGTLLDATVQPSVDVPETPKEDPQTHEHNFSSQTATEEYLCTNATCTSPAMYYYKCIKCNEKGENTYTYGVALGHEYTSKTVNDEYLKSKATCTSLAEYYYKCIRCIQKGESTYTYGSKEAHSFGEYIIVTEANCIQTGSKNRVCTKCNATENIIIPKDTSKHLNVVETEVTKADCTTPGLKRYFCNSCNMIIREEVIPSKGHNYTGATCTEGGNCINCGAVTSPLGHEWNNENPRTCNRCGSVENAIEYEKIPEGGTYTRSDGTVLPNGDNFPTTVTDLDIYEYGDYIYKYRSSYNGWTVDVNEKVVTDISTRTYFGEILETINGENITTLNSTFFGCSNLLSAPEIPQTVNNMDRAFWGCKKLAEAPKIPSNVTNLNMTFRGCNSLKIAPILPDNLTDAGHIFEECHSMIAYEGNLNANGDFSEYIIPSSVTNLEWAFMNCQKITLSPHLPSGITSLDGTYWGCSNLLKAPQIPDSVTKMSGTFRNCYAMTIASELPNNVTILDGTFYGCSSLISAPVIPKNVINMSQTFYNCKSLTGNVEVNTNLIEKATLDSTWNAPTCYECFQLGSYTSGNEIKITGLASNAIKEMLVSTANRGNVTY